MSLLDRLIIWDCTSPRLSAVSVQVYTIMCAEAEACMFEWSSHVLLHLHRCSPGALHATEDVSALLLGLNDAASASLHRPFLQHLTHHQHRLFCTDILALQSGARCRCLSFLSSSEFASQTRQKAVSFWVTEPPCIPSSHLFCSAGLVILKVAPSLVLFAVIHSSKHCSAKSSQAVSSSWESVFRLGSWSPTAPLEDDPVDEDWGDGPWGAAGETEECHQNHRWVTVWSSYRAWFVVFLISGWFRWIVELLVLFNIFLLTHS